jgi:hypothetical protein
VIGHMDPQRREQQIDQRDEWRGMFNGFHSPTLYYFSQARPDSLYLQILNRFFAQVQAERAPAQ